MGTAMAKTAARRDRIEARVSAEQKALLQRAADLSGCTLTEFVVKSAQAAAEETIRTYEVIRLTQEESIQFVEALLHPPTPNENLRRAWQRYEERFGTLTR